MIKDKVNNKLIRQERKCYIKEKRELKNQYYNKEITKDEYYNSIYKIKGDTLKTKPSPQFIEVIEKYEKFRATCNKGAKTCSIEIK